MAKRKSTSRKSTPKRSPRKKTTKTKSRSKKTTSKKRTYSRRRKKKPSQTRIFILGALKVVGVLMILGSILYLIPGTKRPFLLYLTKYQQVQPKDWATKRIKKVIDLHNSLWENPDNETLLIDLLAEQVAWFDPRDKPRYTSKYNIKLGSEYDQFHFISRPIFDGAKDIDNHNYQVRFTGMFVYRNARDKGKLIEVENYLVKIVDQKVTWLKPNRKDAGLAIEETINKLFKYSFFYTVVAIALFVLGLILLSKLPEWLLKKLADTIQLPKIKLG